MKVHCTDLECDNNHEFYCKAELIDIGKYHEEMSRYESFTRMICKSRIKHKKRLT